jgi:hypothetical protein
MMYQQQVYQSGEWRVYAVVDSEDMGRGDYAIYKAGVFIAWAETLEEAKSKCAEHGEVHHR